MITRSNSPHHSRLKAFSLIAGALVVLIGLLVLFGWALDLPTLKSVFPGLVTMKANTAAALALGGLSLLLQANEPAARWRRGLAQALALAIALLGVLTLVEYLAGWQIGVDQMLFREPEGAVGTSSPGRMAPNTALAFVMLGLALLLLEVKVRRVWLAQVLSFLTGLVGFLSLVGYAYGATSLYGLGRYTQMAVHTALSFVLLAGAILTARRERGLMAIAVSESLGGLVLRVLLPTAILIPLLLGWLTIQGQVAGLYDTDLGLALFAAANAVVLTVLIGWSAGLLHRLHLERDQTEEALLERTKELAKKDLYVEWMVDPMWILDDQDASVDVNPAFVKMFGYEREEVLGRNVFEFVDEANRAILEREFAKRRQGQSSIYELSLRAKDGSNIPVLVSGSPILENGKVVGKIGILKDIRAPKELERQLRENAAQLAAANAELEAFSYSVSHDLRAPLRAMDGISQALTEDYREKLDEQGKMYLGRIQGAARRMAELIDALLSLSRVTRAEIHPERVDLSEMAREICEGLRKQDLERQVEFDIAERAEAQGDPRLLRAVLTNLLENAWKFTSGRASARIVFGQNLTGGERTFFVRDSGVGFDMAYVDKLFGAFQRLHSQEEFPGAGIGLATVRRIINRHGGRVWAEAAVGQGACFYFSLPG